MAPREMLCSMHNKSIGLAMFGLRTSDSDTDGRSTIREIERVMDSASNTTAGADGCHCIDASETLADLVERSCTTSDGEDGVLLTVTGPCVDFTFGSSSCLPHDLDVYPPCQAGPDDVIPAYCNLPWCYVDASSCTRDSSERVFRSTDFPHGSHAELVSLLIIVTEFVQ